MVVGGRSAVLLATLDLIDSLRPRVIVLGHGKIPTDPEALIRSTPGLHHRVTGLDAAGGAAGDVATAGARYLPPMDARRPVSLDSRLRRNGVRVYLEMEHA